MPKRTNAFQKLIALVNKQLAGHANVMESALLTDTVTGEQREVDVLIETSIAGYDVKLGIECIDHKRKAGAPWVEGMVQKHENLPTNILILVSRSGFFVPALKKAKFYNVPAYSLGEAVDQDWLQRVQSLTFSSLRFGIMIYTFQLIDTLEGVTIKNPLMFYDLEGQPQDLIGMLRSEIVSNFDVNRSLLNLLADKKDANQLVLAVDLTAGKYKSWYIIDSGEQKHYLRWFRMHVMITRSEVTKKVGYGKYGDANIAFVLPDETQSDMYVFTQSKDGSVTVAVDSMRKENEAGEKLFAEYRLLGDHLVRMDTEE